MTVFDDDAAAEGQREPERERFVLLVRPTDEGVLVVGASREDVDEALAALRNQLLIAGPLALAVAGGLGYLVAGAGLRPIERMRARAATISARSAGSVSRFLRRTTSCVGLLSPSTPCSNVSTTGCSANAGSLPKPVTTYARRSP